MQTIFKPLLSFSACRICKEVEDFSVVAPEDYVASVVARAQACGRPFLLLRGDYDHRFCHRDKKTWLYVVGKS